MSLSFLANAADFLTIGEVSRLLPGAPSQVTVHRWLRIGYRGTKLKSVRIGQRIVIEKRHLQEFLDAINAEDPAARAEA